MTITPDHDMNWTTVTLKPPLEAKAGEATGTLMSPCGRILVATQPDRAAIYRRNKDGEYELISEVNLT